MRVLLAMAGARHGGAERFFERLAIALARHGVEERAVIRRDAARAERLCAAGVDVTELPFGGPFDLVSRRRFHRALRAFRPDVVLSFMSRAAALCPRSSAELDFVHVGRLGGYYNLKYYRTCDHLIANTPDIRRYLTSNGIAEDRAHYLPNFAEAGPVQATDRRHWDTPADRPLLVALGRLHANKAFDVLLDAVARLPTAYLWLAGEGPLRNDLEAQARTLGIADRVRFLGWQEDPRPVIAAADIVVVPSRREPLGNVILEAWAQGKAVVAAAAAGPKQLVTDGEDGMLVAVDDAAALAGAIAVLIDDPGQRADLGRRGHAAFEARFGQETVIDAYLDLFRKIQSQRQGVST
jgi:glycosyltransferase involved in cell wall biosynthesis